MICPRYFDYRREPTLLTPQAVHALVRSCLTTNAHQTWGVAVAEASDLIATRLSDTHAALTCVSPGGTGGIRAHGVAPLAWMPCVRSWRTWDTCPFLREQLAAREPRGLRHTADP